MRWYYILPLLVLLLPLSTWMALTPGGSHQAVAPPALPDPAPVEMKGLLQSILAHNLWDKARGQLTATGQPSATIAAVVSCRLKGIAYAQMQPPQTMFDCDKKLIVLHEGDVLPDKWLLREIHADHVVMERAGEMRKEYLFGKKEEDIPPRITQGASGG